MVLKEVHETELFKHISKFLSTVGYEDSLTYAAAKACCQGAEILSGCSSKEFCCRETCVTCVKGMSLMLSLILRLNVNFVLTVKTCFPSSRSWRGRRHSGDWSCGA